VEATCAPAKRITVGNVINETFSIYGQNAVPLIASAIVVFVIVGVAAALLQNTGGLVLGVLAGIVHLAGYALYTGFVVRLVQDARDGRRDQTVGDLIGSAAPAIGPLIVFGILFGIGVGIGLILLIVPGLILLTLWSVGAPGDYQDRRLDRLDVVRPQALVVEPHRGGLAHQSPPLLGPAWMQGLDLLSELAELGVEVHRIRNTTGVGSEQRPVGVS
jgi:hypothetical protein